MAHPRYAVASTRLSVSLPRALLGTTILALALLLCIPALRHTTGNRVSAATAPIGSTPSISSTSLPSTQTSAFTSWLAGIAIRPSKISTSVPKPVKVADAGLFGPAGALGELGIPAIVLRAYHLAADKLAVEQPACKLPWWLLAGIGHAESGHAESGRVYADGTTRGLILGPRLDGSIAGDAIVTDTDHGKYDGDTVYDRAVGPMQFIPSTWIRWAADGNGDGKKDPSNIFDATLAAGRYLCAGGRDLSSAAGLEAAVLSYNHSQPYLATVLAWGFAYRDGALALADSPLPVVRNVTEVRPPLSSRPHSGQTGVGGLPASSAPPRSAESGSSTSSTGSSATCTSTTDPSGSSASSPSTTGSSATNSTQLVGGQTTAAPQSVTSSDGPRGNATVTSTLASTATPTATATTTSTVTASTVGAEHC